MVFSSPTWNLAALNMTFCRENRSSFAGMKKKRMISTPADSALALRFSSPTKIQSNGCPVLRIKSRTSHFHRKDIYIFTRRGPNQLVHDETGESYSLYEAIELFANYLPPAYRVAAYGEEPTALKQLISNIDCHLIETQRLLILREEDPEPYRPREQRSSLAISKKAQTLKSIVARELAAYATLSQSLDRTFPRRVIELGQRAVLAPEDLKSKLADLETQAGQPHGSRHSRFRSRYAGDVA